jgi:hypothetical protein
MYYKSMSDDPKQNPRIKYPDFIDLKYGYLTEKFTASQGFPMIFFCKNYKCNADFRATNFEQYEAIKNNRICTCGWRLMQYVLKDDENI